MLNAGCCLGCQTGGPCSPAMYDAMHCMPPRNSSCLLTRRRGGGSTGAR